MTTPVDTAGLSSTLGMSLADAALEYGRRGFRVIPIHHLTSRGMCSCGSCDPEHLRMSAQKHPAIRQWQTLATSSAPQIRSWWRADPDYGIGVVMGGAARLVALDVDGDLGRASLVELERRFGALPETTTSRSGGGGEHRLFVVPQGVELGSIRNRAGKLGAEFLGRSTGLDVRAERGQIVVSPTQHRSGSRYRWVCDARPAPLPRWLFDLMVGPIAPPPPPARSRCSAVAGDVVRRASAYLAHLPDAVAGQGGHDATWRAALALVRGFDLPPEVACDLLVREYNPRCRPPWSEKELWHKVVTAGREGRVPPGYLLARARGTAA